MRNITEKLKNYVNGEWVESETDEYREIVNPATTEVIAEAPMSTEEEVEEVVSVAKERFDTWRNESINGRIDPLYKYTQVLEENQEDLAETIVKEHGKEWPAAVGEVRRAIQMVQNACAGMEMQKGGFSENVANNLDEYSVMRPLGVFAMIPPFNFPAMVPWWFAPYAVAVGDTYIIKPNEKCPMTQQHMFKLIDEELDLSPGVINLINGGPDVANQLMKHQDIEGISFVGSVPIAKKVYETCAKEGKRVQAQAGANNFHIVTPSANLEKTIDNLMGPYWGNTGQRCLAGSILVGIGDIYDELKEKFIESTKELKIGYGMDKDTDIGPVVTEDDHEKLLDWIETGLEEGAELILDGRDVEVEEYPDGYFLGPTIFKAEPGMKIFDEEVFGPIACLYQAEDLDEAMELVNDSNYGNAVTIYTEKGSEARKFRNEVKVGNVGINVGTVAPMAYYPFGGMKDSFFGDLHGQGNDVINFFADRQVVIRRWFGD